MEEQKSIEDIKQLCPNCQFHLDDLTQFCPKCGQKQTNGRFTVKELFSQFFDNVFNLDSKIFKTIGALFVPGKLTNAFLDGKRQKYYHPIRLFLILILISLACFNFQNDNVSIPMDLKKEGIDKLKERKRLMGILEESTSSISAGTDKQAVIEALDTLKGLFYGKSGKRIDSVNISDALRITDDFDFNVAIDDFGKYSPDEILDVYQVKGLYKRLLVRQKVRMIEEGTSFLPFVMGKVTWVIFFVLLLLTLIFRLFYFKSDFLYLEHLIFGIHLNSFFLIVLSIITFFPEKSMGGLLPCAFLIMAVYFFIAIRRVYKQSFIVTFLKFIFFIICYFFFFLFGFILTVIGSFLIF